ncbi:ferric reductase-like transmembrane domain-containing protein [Pseudofrankia inefficax]|uniref:Ferric reductase domain protein protein transmembrane component domain protein n=1 Tax=Pseudofrankia inefficax (strain DSM 45817 / CECT 9037 / DDB 130130 / EuI1c) TaxID=298654 RepID=E3IWX2_PSEI1|nr:ferric reductase-like transmembrane domain-containing protein [Pseudofrankia inefficax]ADP82596.1 Ferric reductase domain protein protein transmembrane component domain protein [Pseudofrankia inefficax]
MSQNVLWYTARGTGLTLLLVLTLTLVLGIVARRGQPAAGLPGFALAAVHRNASLLALALLVIHVTTLVLDPLAHIAVIDTVVPFAAGYRPLWVGLGTCAADLLLAVVVTSLLRQRIGARVWRGVHWAAYAAWPVAFLHSLGTGTDVGTWWQLTVAVVCALAVAVAAGWRCSASFQADRAGAARPAATGPAQPLPRPLGQLYQPAVPRQNATDPADGELAR